MDWLDTAEFLVHWEEDGVPMRTEFFSLRNAREYAAALKGDGLKSVRIERREV